MNKKQKIVLWLGIVVFVLLGLTTQTRFLSGILKTSPRHTDYGPVTVRLLCTVVVTGGLIYTLKDKEDDKPKDEQKQ